MAPASETPDLIGYAGEAAHVSSSQSSAGGCEIATHDFQSPPDPSVSQGEMDRGKEIMLPVHPFGEFTASGGSNQVVVHTSGNSHTYPRWAPMDLQTAAGDKHC